MACSTACASPRRSHDVLATWLPSRRSPQPDPASAFPARSAGHTAITLAPISVPVTGNALIRDKPHDTLAGRNLGTYPA